MSRTYIGVNTLSLVNGAGKTRYSHAENDIRPLRTTIHKNQHKVIERFKPMISNYKVTRTKQEKYLRTLVLAKILWLRPQKHR